MTAIRCLRTILTIIFFSVSAWANAQEMITSVSPTSVYPGQTTDIVIQGMSTAFKNGVTKVNMGPGITVNRVNVSNAATLDANITVSNSALTGTFNDISITTGSDRVTKPGAISIFAKGAGIRATILVTPVQSIHLSDFDPSNINSAPLLFTITLYNGPVVQDIEVLLTVSGQKFGAIGTAKKTYHQEPAGKIETLNNRQFDKYQVASTNQAAIQAAIQTGTLPSDVYDYNVQILDDNGNLLSETDGTNIISNQESKPELISPGNPFFSDPTLVHTNQPVFEWFAQANSVDLYIYEVYPGQNSAAAVAINRPTYFMKDILASSFLYPSGAPLLLDGHTYAWQILANYSTAAGPTQLTSDMFWFTVATSKHTEGTHTIAELVVSPANMTMQPGQSFKFSVKALDLRNDTVAIQPLWTIIPAEGGTIDANGNFVAGNTRKTVAIIAAYGGVKDYATVIIEAAAKGIKPEKTH